MKYFFPAVLILVLFTGCKRNNDEMPVCQLSNNPYYYYGYGSGIMVPNAFTPNGDGRNDGFRALGDSNQISSYNLSILENGGNVLFESGNMHEAWNGTNTNGKQMLPGRYVARVSYRFLNGEMRTDQYCIALLSYGGQTCIPASIDGSYYFEDMYDPNYRSFNYNTGERICY